jgi:hypothetical protein
MCDGVTLGIYMWQGCIPTVICTQSQSHACLSDISSTDHVYSLEPLPMHPLPHAGSATGPS